MKKLEATLKDTEATLKDKEASLCETVIKKSQATLKEKDAIIKDKEAELAKFKSYVNDGLRKLRKNIASKQWKYFDIITRNI